MSWLQIKKIVTLKCPLHLFYATTTNHFSIGLWCVTKSGSYTITSDDQLSSRTEKKWSQTCTKKRVHDCCLVVCCLSNPLWFPESWWNHYTWEIWSANQLDAPKMATHAASVDQQKEPNSLRQRLTTCHTTNASKVEWIRLRGFASSAIFTWPLANWLPLPWASWQLFTGKMLLQPAGCRKCFPRACQIPKQGFLCYGNRQIYFLLAKMCWL